MSADRPKLLVDTNIIVDFLNVREPFYQPARLLMTAGKVGEFNLWVSSSQVTDLIYILTEGGKPHLLPKELDRLRRLRTFVGVANVGADEIDSVLDTAWTDAEDALLHQVALSLHVDCIVSRDKKGFTESLLPVLDCEELFEWLKETRSIIYSECEF